MASLDDRKYADTHEWVKVDGDVVVVGISDHAQDALGDITFVELPEIDAEFTKGDDVAVVESVKAASDIYAPISGTVSEINEALEDEPEVINTDAYNDGWIFKLKDFDTAELENLMSAADYDKFLEDNE